MESTLKLLKSNHQSQMYRLEDNITKVYPKKIASLSESIDGLKTDISRYNEAKASASDFSMTIFGQVYDSRKEAGEALMAVAKAVKPDTSKEIGEYMGFKIIAKPDSYFSKTCIQLTGQVSHYTELGDDPVGNMIRLSHTLETMPEVLSTNIRNLEDTERQLEIARQEVGVPFPQEDELKEKQARQKEVITIEVGENESSKYWLSVLNSLKNRGVKDILIICADGLTGIKEAIAAAYPKTEYQRCIVHQVRNTLKYVSDKDKKSFARDLKTIYNAPDEKKGLEARDKVSAKWGEKYPNAMKSWERNWDAITPIFKFSSEVRSVIYTTNAIESLNSTYRKLNRQRSVFPSSQKKYG